MEVIPDLRCPVCDTQLHAGMSARHTIECPRNPQNWPMSYLGEARSIYKTALSASIHATVIRKNPEARLAWDLIVSMASRLMHMESEFPGFGDPRAGGIDLSAANHWGLPELRGLRDTMRRMEDG